RRDILRWPRIETTPLSGAGFEDVSFRRSVFGVVFEEAAEKGQLDFLAVKLRGLRAEVDIAQFVAHFSSPIAVRPLADDEHVGYAGILAFGPAIGFERAEEVFSVIPTADGHDGAVNVFEVRADVASLPE